MGESNDQTFPVLRMLTGAEFGREFPLKRQRVIIGRELTCGIVLEEPVLSRRHCAIFEENGHFYVADLQSKNGTFLNGHRIEKTKLEDGDVIRVGSTRLEFIAPGSKRHQQQKSEFNVRRTSEMDAVYADPLIGRIIDSKYTIEDKIGEGGMGAVYRGTKLEGNLPTAIKLMNRNVALEPDQVQRFQREFETGQLLVHPNIVAVYDFGEYEGTFYLVMEFVEGHGLQDILDIRGRLSPRGAIKVALQVALALEHAYSVKVIHRDIKPENILITPQGVVKVLDLGLAKRIKETAGAPSITRTGEGIGTLHYMAPEQTINARDTDQRSDIYALGATLYHMLAGEPPFEAEGIWEFVDLIQHAQPKPLTEHVPNLPEQIWYVVERALAKHPRDRYQTPRELRKALEECLKLV